MTTRTSSARCERGAATVGVTLALVGALLVGVLYAHRGNLLETRMAANQVRATAAFEAAEAGIEWALAKLNEPARVGTDCRADATAAAGFRALAASGVRPACVRRASGWACRCSADALTTLPPPDDAVDTPAFALEVLPGPRPGLATLVAIGCSDATSACLAADSAAGARARIEAGIALLPALASEPAAMLTARGAIETGSAAVELHDPDPAAPGIALHAGGTIAAAGARFGGPAGASSAGRLAGLDESLAALDTDRLFAAHFGLPKAAWRDQPMARRLHCTASDCSAELAATIGTEVDAPLVWIDGDAALAGPLTLGRPDRPVALVVTGRLELRGSVTLNGLAYAGAIGWRDGGTGVHGALVSETELAGDAAATFVRDPAVLAGLRRTGSYVKLPGGWRDF